MNSLSNLRKKWVAISLKNIFLLEVVKTKIQQKLQGRIKKISLKYNLGMKI